MQMLIRYSFNHIFSEAPWKLIHSTVNLTTKIFGCQRLVAAQTGKQMLVELAT